MASSKEADGTPGKSNNKGARAGAGAGDGVGGGGEKERTTGDVAVTWGRCRTMFINMACWRGRGVAEVNGSTAGAVHDVLSKFGDISRSSAK